MVKWTPIGEMRTPITIQARSNAVDDAGGQTGDWTDIVTVAAKAEQLGGSERFTQGQFQPEGLWKLSLRYYPGISALNRVKIAADTLETEDHYLDILNISDLESRHRELQMVCKERVGLSSEQAQ